MTEANDDRAAKQGWVYFAHVSILQRVKIGWAGDYRKRLEEIQCGCPEIVQIVGAKWGTRADERRMHALFASLRVHGEWFIWCDEICDYVNSLDPRIIWYPPAYDDMAESTINRMVSTLPPQLRVRFLEALIQGEDMDSVTLQEALAVPGMEALIAETFSFGSIARNRAASAMARQLNRMKASA